MVQLTEEQLHDLLVGAARYYLGRSTIQVHQVIRHIRDLVPHAPGAAGIILRDVTEALVNHRAGEVADQDAWTMLQWDLVKLTGAGHGR